MAVWHNLVPQNPKKQILCNGTLNYLVGNMVGRSLYGSGGCMVGDLVSTRVMMYHKGRPVSPAPCAHAHARERAKAV